MTSALDENESATRAGDVWMQLILFTGHVDKV
jgi:hypothetical protein